MASGYRVPCVRSGGCRIHAGQDCCREEKRRRREWLMNKDGLQGYIFSIGTDRLTGRNVA